MLKIYIFENDETAIKVKRTVDQHTGSNVQRVGSAIEMTEELYKRLIDETYAPEAEWTATPG